jgi:hypothetical protein
MTFLGFLFFEFFFLTLLFNSLKNCYIMVMTKSSEYVLVKVPQSYGS